jgi:hypothetical protein
MMGLEYEAERLVRSGMPRAEVSRMLGVHTQTLAQWALQGQWRKKDLDLEGSGSETQRTIRNVATAHARRKLERDTLEAQARVVREAIRLIAEKGPEAAGDLRRLMARVRRLPQLGAQPAPAPAAVAAPRGRSLGKVRIRTKDRPKRLEKYDI